ncbi:YphA family membrane protein [Peribacillus loiseleuriae]|uniref:Uncharacterized protein n=1 Tax=Peribacillus loiseleuriae TaxID=1679170 RepID=A0A0K9GVA2_9BACI|nr:hypothetical protein [Peribacillus loiseleuriae]KMY50619.1 hypothetical protein AC625_14790 [Peribacillus loiseleuriae]
MEGLLFYWIAWITWVIVMFFFSKAQVYRFPLLVHLLAVMGIAGYIIHIGRYSFGFAGIYLLFVVLIYHRRLSLYQFAYFMLSCSIIALSYASFQLFTLLDPLWVFVNPTWLAALVLHFLTLFLYKGWKQRISSILVGMILGDGIYMITMVHNSLPYTAISYILLDMMTISVSASLFWSGLEWLSVFAMNYMQNKFQTGQKQL